MPGASFAQQTALSASSAQHPSSEMIVSAVVVSCLVAVVAARPEAPVPYSYPVPATRQQLPIAPPSSSYLPGPSYVSPSTYLSPSPSPVYQQDTYASRAPLIQKHVYVHVAPEEPTALTSPTIITPQGPPRKHYKLVFIKAPNPPAPGSTQVQLPQRDEEKTLIYVLSKKPEDASAINIATPPPTPPSKPEVYFIRYKSQEEQSPSLGAPLYGAPPSPGTRYGAPFPEGNSLPTGASASSGPY